MEQWWRCSKDKAALSELFNSLVENIPKPAVENGKESVLQPISSRDASCDWTYAASVLEQGELAIITLGDPDQASAEWQEARANALSMLDQFIQSKEPTKGDQRLSRRRYAELAHDALRSIDRNTKFLVNQVAITQDLATPSLADGKVAKALRNTFIAEYCRAVWVPLPDTADIAGLERAVIALAPAEAIGWNNRATEAYAEPVDLVDAIIAQLGFDAAQIASLERQNQRYAAAKAPHVPPFPIGPFRFFALDVETANHERASICQIGVACVRPDNTIATWVTYIDPKVDHWAFTYLHKIDARTVRGAPVFGDVLPVLRNAIQVGIVYQHSNFDRGAMAAACQKNALPEPEWHWRDSVQVARRAWPELRGNGGHGLASLKTHLGLSFAHHDAGEDARAPAEVVLHAEASHAGTIPQQEEDFDLIENI